MGRWSFLVFALILLAAPGWAQQTIDFGRFHALVIGNNDYEHLKDLKTAVADAEAVAKVLEEKYGFRVIRLTNATRRGILQAMEELTKVLTEQDNLLIYYAGHGVLDKTTDTGFWQPVDARPDNEIDWIPTTTISRYLRRMNAGHVMVVADSYYAGALLMGDADPSPRAGETRQAWLDRLTGQRARTVLTSGGLKPVADSAAGEHSVFAGVLLEVLRNNADILDGATLFDRVKPMVIQQAKQIPNYGRIRFARDDQSTGDFLLVPQSPRETGMALPEQPTLPDDVAENPSANPAEVEAALALAREDRREVQQALNALGFDAGPEDGLFGTLTRAAITAFQQARGYPTTGYLTAGQWQALAAESPEPKPVTVIPSQEWAPEMVEIQGGCFQMGSPPDERGRYKNERLHQVCVKDFAIGQYEVTFEQYDRFAEATGRNKPDDQGWGRDKRPVINVSWHDAVVYADWLSQETGKSYRLPTEAEWEYAARGGTRTAFWWGEAVGRNNANCRGCGSQWDGKQTAPVGSFKASPYGLYDTAGNVWEWTCSGYDADYGGAEQRCVSDNPVDSPLRVVRGGGWDDFPESLRPAFRYWSIPDAANHAQGFRLARDL